MSLSSFLLVMYEYGGKETRKAGIFYFVMTQLSTAFLMFGFLTMYTMNGSFDITPTSSGGVMVSLVFISLFIGFCIKAGAIPFHKWLPYAHTACPSNISALMSGVMIKVAVYGLIRFTSYALYPGEIWWGVLILAAGMLSAILGVIYALKEHDIKRLLAYHSIENIGIIFIGYGAYLLFSAEGIRPLALLSLAWALFHTLNHAVFKSLFVHVSRIRRTKHGGKKHRRDGWTYQEDAKDCAAVPCRGCINICASPVQWFRQRIHDIYGSPAVVYGFGSVFEGAALPLLIRLRPDKRACIGVLC